eukprot:jgi/Botrbrau1/10686/Bobra.139_2s0016.1
MFLSLLVSVLGTSFVILCALAAYTCWIFYGGSTSAKRKHEKEMAGNGPKRAPSLHSKPSAHLTLDTSQQYSLSWDSIKLEVAGSQGFGPKMILRGVSGTAAPGELVALCGPSGAGKSTLMDILAMRLRPTSGKILVGGRPQTAAFFRTISAYVPQESSFIPTLTVWETLRLTMGLRIARKMDREEREETMNSILSSMGLSKVKFSRVGGTLPGGLTLRGLSGGEARRLHIACRVVDAPSVIFLDEPTSGLDSHSALVLMQHLQYLAEGGRTIISSIHQPRQAIWDMFNKLVLLAEGYLMYFGPVTEATDWFHHRLGYSYNVEEQGLPADWLLDLVSIGFHNSLHSYGFQTAKQLEDASQKFIHEKLVMPNLEIIGSPKDSISSSATPGTPTESIAASSDIGAPAEQARLCGLLPYSSPYPTSFWNQLRWLMYRNMLEVLRNPADLMGRLLLNLLVGIMEGMIFMGPSYMHGGKADSVSILTSVFFIMVAGMLQPLTHMSLYVADRQFFLIDCADNLYSPLAYYISHTVVSIPIIIVTGQALFLTMYGFVGLSENPSAIFISMAATSDAQHYEPPAPGLLCLPVA